MAYISTNAQKSVKTVVGKACNFKRSAIAMYMYFNLKCSKLEKFSDTQDHYISRKFFLILFFRHQIFRRRSTHIFETLPHGVALAAVAWLYGFP